MAHSIDSDEVKHRARGRWHSILPALSVIDSSALSGRHCPCPKCGGHDRFRFTDQDGDGSAICNQCMTNRCGDGFAVLRWATGWGFREIVDRVADCVGMAASAPRGADANSFLLPASREIVTTSHPATQPQPQTQQPPRKPTKSLTSQIKFADHNPDWLASLSAAKSPATPAAITAAHGRCCRWDSMDCIAFPAFRDPSQPPSDANLIGIILYRADGSMFPPRGKLDERKTHMLYGSKDGWVVVGGAAALAAATTVICTEGVPDALSIHHLLPPGWAVATNICGASARQNLPTKSLAGKDVVVIGDSDQPGHKGAEAFAKRLASSATAKSVKFPQLPYEVAPTKGKDLRDYVGEFLSGPTPSFAPLAAIIDRAAIITADPTPNQAQDDPHRLAQAFLQSEDHSTHPTGFPTYRFWRELWYRWDGISYQRIHHTELRGLIASFVRKEFDRLNVEDLKSAGASGGEPPTAMVVSNPLVSNIILAMTGICLVAGEVTMPYWLDNRPHNQQDGKHWICLRNGLVDVRTLLAGEACETPPEVIPHTPAFFSNVSIPYDYDESATCPTWDSFIVTNFESDQDRIAILQEWYGYNLVHDLTHQKFLMLEGEGNNGKSVICAVLSALLGPDNVSSVSLENFEKDFHLTSTLGKLANIVSEAGEIERVGEGYLKSFTSGDRMSFNRKNRDLVDAIPTARFTLATNNRPRFSDKSGGLWRRMILMPLTHIVPESEKVLGMDKVEWWAANGELPGIFNWAIEGLRRLRRQGRFTESAINEQAKLEYRDESNAARRFLTENYHELPSHLIMVQLKTLDVYDKYRKWCIAHGNSPMADAQLGKEVRRIFKSVTKKNAGPRSERYYIYHGLELGPAPTAESEAEERREMEERDYFKD